MARQRKIDGIVIRRSNVNEADRIVTLLTPQGKEAVVAKGIRKVTSRKNGAFELFHVVHVLVYETASLPTVKEVSLVRTFPRLRDDLQAAGQAFWAAEMIDRLATDEAGGSLYRDLLLYLERVSDGATNLDIRAFELTVLQTLGWQPQLHVCAHCSQPLAPGRFGWSNQHGGVLDDSCVASQGATKPISQSAIKALRLLSGQGLTASHRLAVPAQVGQEVQEILHHYLESIGERQWRSPELLDSSQSALS